MSTLGSPSPDPRSRSRQIDYHLSRIERGDSHAQIQAIDALGELLRDDNSRRLEVADRLANAVGAIADPEVFRRACMIRRACTLDNSAVLQEIEAILISPQSVAAEGESAVLSLFSSITPLNEEGLRLIERLLEACAAPTKAIFLITLMSRVCYSEQSIAKVLEDFLLRSEKAQKSLAVLAHASSESGAEGHTAAMILSRIGKPLPDIHSEGISVEISGELIVEEIERSRWDPHLTHALRSAAVPPVELLAEEFRRGRQLIGLAIGGETVDLKTLTAEVLQLAREVGLTHLAVPLPNILSEQVQKLRDGQAIPPLLRRLDGQLWDPGFDAADVIEEYHRKLGEALRMLSSAVKVVLIDSDIEGASPTGLTGELLDEYRAGLLRSIFHEHPAAKVLALGTPFEWASGLDEQGRTSERTFGNVVRTELGSRSVAHIFQFDLTTDFQFIGFLPHPLISATEALPIAASFGVATTEAALKDLRWESFRAKNRLIRLDWDGLIYRHHGEDDPDFFREQNPDPVLRVPRPSPNENLVKQGLWDT